MRSSEQNVERLKSKFQKIKKSVLKKYPGATTKIDSNGEFYLADKNGRRILSDMLLYPSQKNVYDAWYVVDHVTKAEAIIARNNQRFSDEKICKATEKEK